MSKPDASILPDLPGTGASAIELPDDALDNVAAGADSSAFTTAQTNTANKSKSADKAAQASSDYLRS